jgi:hypothetical protein
MTSFGVVTICNAATLQEKAAEIVQRATEATSKPNLEKPNADTEALETQPPTAAQTVPQDLIPGTKLDKDRLVRLSRTDAVWLDKASKTVIVAGSVCNRQGPLEMFACPRGTKEYESVVAVDSRAQIVHAALLAAGIKPGKPVVFAPEYKSATGPIIEITVVWTDHQTKKQHRVLAQQWVRHVASKQPLSTEWVFAGSGFWKDPDTGREQYLAEGGELVCVSNFSTATLDLPISSPQANDNLFFDAFTDRIPPQGTPVWLLMREKKNGAQAPK